MGLKSAIKKKKDRKKFQWKDRKFKVRTLNLYAKSDPLEVQIRLKELFFLKFKKAKQPNSAMRKCCKVQLTKNGRTVTAFIQVI